MTKNRNAPARALATAVMAAATLAGCASTPPPTDKLALAESAIQRAERAGALQAAPGEYNAAREKLQRAHGTADRDPEVAARLAEQAEIDATLAEARAEAQRARNAQTTVEQSLEALRQEATRGVATAPGVDPGATPSTPAGPAPTVAPTPPTGQL